MPESIQRSKQGYATFTRAERWFILSLCTLTLLLRFSYLAEIRSNPFFEHPRLDALFHDMWAKSIVSGNVIGDKVFFRAPVYPYFLAMTYAIVGHDYLFPRIIQHVMGIGSILLLYLLSKHVFGIRTAMIAAILASVYPMLIYFEGELLFESLLVFMCLLWLFFIERWKDNENFIPWIIIGVISGVVCGIRPLFLGVIPLVIVRTVWRDHRQGRTSKPQMAGFVLGCALVLLPIAIRNYLVGHDFVLIASQGGVNFFIGNNPSSDGSSSMMPGSLGPSWENRDVTFLVEKTIGHPPSPSEESWFWYTKGFDFIINSPAQSCELILKKAYLFWNWYEIPNNQNFYSFRQYSRILRYLPFGFWMVAPIGLLGMVIAIYNRQGIFYVAFMSLYTAIIIMFFVCDRFRLPIVPLLCMFAGYAIHTAIEHVHKSGWRHLLLLCAAGCSFGFLVNSNFYGVGQRTTARDSASLGIVELGKGNLDKAIEYFSQAVSSNGKPWPNVLLNWGVAEWRKGNTVAAIEKFHQELVYYPEATKALANLAAVHLSLGNNDSAIYFGSKAVGLKPYEPDSYISVAKAFQNKHETLRAISILEEGKRHCGEDFMDGQLFLGDAYRSIGRLDDARETYQRITTRKTFSSQPSYEPEYDYGATRQDPKSDATLRASAFYGLGHIHAARHHLDSAMSMFRAAVDIAPGFGDAWADLGVACMQLGHYNDADSAFEAAIRLRPRNELYLYNYATLLGITGRLTEARELLERALMIRPDLDPARKQLALVEALIREKRTHQ